MSYLPLTTNTSQIAVRIGVVKTNCAMTNGSATFAASGLGLLTSDIGLPAMVFGAGPGGAPLITTVATRSSGNGGTLAAAASTTVADATIIIFRAHECLKGTIWWNGSLTVRGTARFSIASASFEPLVGMPVLIHDSVDGDLFGGSIASVKASNTYYSQTYTRYDVECEGYEKLLAKRTTGDLTDDPMNPATSNPLNGTFRQMSMGDIGTYLIENAYGGDGMGVTAIAGPTLDFGTRLEYGDACLDRLVGLASNDVDKYFWYIDPWRVAVLAKQSTYVAPFNIKDNDGSDSNVRLAVSVTRDRQKYVNRGIADLGAYIGDAVTESYPGDGSSQQFGLVNPVGAQPGIQVDGVDQTVGILNSDTGKDWYYNVNSNIITQDPGGTPLTAMQTIAITYQPLIQVEVEYQNSTAVDERSGVEGGTGYYERVVATNTPTAYSDGLALATAIASNFATIPERVELQTYRGGLRPGMYIDIRLTDIGVDSRFLIDSVTLTTEGNLKLYTFTAIDGALIGDWRATLAAAFGSGSGSSSGGGTGSGGTSAPADAIVTISADTTLSTGAQIVEIDTTGGNVTATLPSASTMIGQRITLKKTVAANSAIVDGAGTETIDGATTYTMTDQYQSVTIEAFDATSWLVIAAAVAVTPPSPTAPGNFTIGTLSYQWIETININAAGKRATRNGAKLRITIPVTPPSPIGTTKGGHIYIEIPDQSTDASATMDGATTMNGSTVMQGNWTPADMGKFPYVAATQPWYIDLDANITDTTLIRVDVSSYSDEVDVTLVQFGQAGASPSATLSIAPYSPPKAASGTNRTNLLVTSLSSSVAAAQYVGGKLVRPISVTVDLSGLPAVLPDNWAYQLRGYRDGVISDHPELQSGYFRTDGIVPAGPDGITAAHTFAPEEPTESISVVIYAVAGLISAGSAKLGNEGPVFTENNIVPLITASTTVTYGTTTGVTDPTAFVQALLSSVFGTVSSKFDITALAIDTARLAALSVEASKLAAGAVTATKMAPSSVTASNAALAPLAVVAASLAAGSITVANAALAAQAVVAANMGVGSVTAGNAAIAALAVVAGSMAASSITAANGAIASLAVGRAGIQLAAINQALIDTLAVGRAQIIGLAVGTAEIDALAVTTAKIASLAVTDAKINDLAAGKITAGTIAASVSMTSPDLTVTNASFVCKMNATNGFLITGNTLTTQLNNSNDASSNPAGLIIYTTSGGGYPVSISPGLIRLHESTGGTARWDITCNGSSTAMRLRTPGGGATYTISTASGLTLPGWSVDVTGNASFSGLVDFSGGTSGSAVAGAATLPANPVGFINVKVGGSNYKVPYYT